MHYELMESPDGRIVIAADAAGIRHIDFQDGARPLPVPDNWLRGGLPLLETAVAQLRDYYAGTRTTFDLPLKPVGTPFQKKVWAALCTIPWGHTINYAQLAQMIGKPSAARAVGAANGRNPISIVIPCHRVIGKSGALTGYAGGLAVKRRLLALERPTVVTA